VPRPLKKRPAPLASCIRRNAARRRTQIRTRLPLIFCRHASSPPMKSAGAKWSMKGAVRKACPEKSRRCAAALFVFLAGAAGAGVVASHFFHAARTHTHNAVHIPPAAILKAEGGGFVMHAIHAALTVMRNEFDDALALAGAAAFRVADFKPRPLARRRPFRCPCRVKIIARTGKQRFFEIIDSPCRESR